MKRLWFFRGGGCCLLVLGLLFVSGGQRELPVQIFSEGNTEYLDASFQQALTGFGVLSGLKAGLAVVEGSTGGVSAGVSIQLQVGDVVQAAYDYVDLAWRTIFFGCLSLLSIQFLLQICGTVGPSVLGCLFLALGARILFSSGLKQLPTCKRLLSDLLVVLVFLNALIFLLLPGSIQIAAVLSEQITRPALTSARVGFEQISSDLFPAEPREGAGLWGQIKEVPEELKRMTTVLKERTEQLGLWTVQLVAGYLYDCFLFPLGSFLLLFAGFRMLFRVFRDERNLHRLIAEIRRQGR